MERETAETSSQGDSVTQRPWLRCPLCRVGDPHFCRERPGFRGQLDTALFVGFMVALAFLCGFLVGWQG
jgi:hypothetical protein